MSNQEEIKKYAEELIQKKLAKSNTEETKEEAKEETKEVNFGDLFKSKFSLGSTLEQQPQGNVIANVREHDSDADLEKAYGASPRKPKK